MIKVKRIDHVAIAVSDRDGVVRELGGLFGLCPGVTEHVQDQQTDVAFLHPAAPAPTSPVGAPPAESVESAFAEATALEIIAPAPGGAGNPSLTRFLERRGPGLHHICFEVDDLPTALATLKAAGVRLIDEAPRPGARGHLVAFIHPASTGGVLFELCATRNGAQA